MWITLLHTNTIAGTLEILSKSRSDGRSKQYTNREDLIGLEAWHAKTIMSVYL